MFVNNLNPVILRLGPFALTYYGLVYAAGFLFITHKLMHASAKIKNLDKDKAESLMTIGMIGLVIGARIGHIFFELDYYIAHPLEVFAVWHGGMAFIGGLIGAFVFAGIYCRKHKVNLFAVGDIIALYAPLFLAFGRIANFINSELFGYPTSLPWGVNFNNETNILGELIYRHPSQLYESVLKFSVFAILFFLSKKKRKPGFIFWNFVWLYGLTRFVAEFFRYNAALYFGLSVMQYISIGLFVLGWFFLIRRRFE